MLEMNWVKDAKMENRLTVVICTHDRAELLVRTLASLDAARRPSEMEVDVLVVANACTDDTPERVAAYRDGRTGGLPLRYCEEPQVGKSHALNRAIDMVEAGFLLFVDDDHRVDAGYLEAVVDGIRRFPGVRMFCGQVVPDWRGDEPVWVHAQDRYRIYPLPVPHFELGEEEHFLDDDSRIPGGGNLAIHVDVFQKVGGFSTELGPKGHDLAGSEDSDLVLRAMAAGEKVRYLPDMLQYHYVDLERLRLSYLMRKAYQRSRTLVRVRGGANGVPRYLWKKLALYGVNALFSLRGDRRRFYLVRLSSVGGEIAGFREAQRA